MSLQNHRDAPMLPEQPAITQCHRCVNYYWFEDTEQVREEAQAGDLSSVPTAKLLTATQLQAALEAGAGNTRNREFYLRLHLWWAGNNAQRGKEYASRSEIISEAAAQNNVAALSRLLNPDEPNERMMLAEIARQVGRFEEAMQLLSEKFPPEYKSTVQLMMVAIARKDARLLTLN